MDERPWMTVVIAGYNSEKHLPKLAESLRAQDPPHEGSALEVLYVDGQSQDGSRALATSLGFQVLDNPQGDPIHAKWIGFLRATSPYVCYLDHDERLLDPQSLLMKYQMLEEWSDLHIVLPSGYALQGDNATNAYASEFGDPFSLFAYRSPNRVGFRETSLRRRLALAGQGAAGTVLHSFSRRPIQCEPVAGACVIDAQYFRDLVPELSSNPNLLPHIYYLMVLRDPNSLIAVTRDDPIAHHTVDSMQSLTRKIRWRLVNAGWDTELSKSGFRGRQEILQEINQERGRPGNFMSLSPLAFAIYVVTILPVLFDSVHLAIRRRSAGYLIHFPLSWMVVLWGLSARIGTFFGRSQDLKRYGH